MLYTSLSLLTLESKFGCIYIANWSSIQTHPRTSGIGAPLQARAGASILQRFAQTVPENVELYRNDRDSGHAPAISGLMIRIGRLITIAAYAAVSRSPGWWRLLGITCQERRGE